MGVMRHSVAVVLAAAAGLLAGGCLGPGPEPSASRHEGPPLAGPVGDDVVRLDVYLVERPASDAAFAQDVWPLADEEQGLSPELKSLLEENGFRTGRVGGGLPDELRRLTESERSCADPRRLTLHAGKPTAVVVGPPVAQHAFTLRQNGRPTGVTLDQAQCLLQATPRLADGGRVALRLTPQVRHGAPLPTPRPVQEASGTLRWDLQVQQSCETYAGLSWELTVADDDYVLVGAAPNRPDTLGARAFLCADDAPRRQRLLVLRAARAPTAAAGDEAAPGRAPPLAAQAGRKQ
jgi:hypothetical protein